MENLFDENDDTSFSLFASKNKIKQQAQDFSTKNLPVIEKKTTKIQPHYKCTCYLHSFNQTNNESKELGMFNIKVFKQNDNIILDIISKKSSKQFSRIICSKETHWKYCDDTKCITNIQNIGDVEIEFINMMDAKILTVIVLSVKANQYGNIALIKNSGLNDEDLIKPIDLFTIDFNKLPFEVSDIKLDFIPGKDSLEERFSCSKGPGSMAVIGLGNNVFGFIEVRNLNNKAEQNEANLEVNKPNNIIEHNEEEEEVDKIEQQLDEFQKEINVLFDQTALMLFSFKPRNIEHGKITVSNEKVLYDIQAAINAYEYKNDKLNELQETINKYDEILTENEEKIELNSLIKSINNEIFEEVKKMSMFENENESITKLYQNLQKSLVEQENFYKDKEKEIRNKNQLDLINDKNNLENEIKNQKQKLQQIQNMNNSFKEQLSNIKKENSNMKEKNKDNQEKLKQIKNFNEITKNNLKTVIKDLVVNSFGIISQNITKESIFSGKIINLAIKKALSIAANNVLNEKDNEDNEEEEEEEGIIEN